MGKPLLLRLFPYNITFATYRNWRKDGLEEVISFCAYVAENQLNRGKPEV